MSMRVRELQEYLGKFTDAQKGTAISDCPIYIETQDGHLEEIRKIEVQENVNRVNLSCQEWGGSESGSPIKHLTLFP